MLRNAKGIFWGEGNLPVVWKGGSSPIHKRMVELHSVRYEVWEICVVNSDHFRQLWGTFGQNHQQMVCPIYPP